MNTLYDGIPSKGKQQGNDGKNHKNHRKTQGTQGKIPNHQCSHFNDFLRAGRKSYWHEA